MYKLKFKALQCNKKINAFMQSVDLLQKDCGIGQEVTLTITTKTKPTDDYISKLEKHTEQMYINDIQYMAVKCISVTS